ncbi:glycosyltransferase [Azospirillum thermophilum]|nr:glycosyltransferase [Azospirillum thermophilum]
MQTRADRPDGLRPHGQISWPPYFDAHVWFTFLLRGDVRGTEDVGDEETRRRFLMWWLCFGRKEHAPWPATPEQRRIAWEPIPFPGPPGGLTVPRILHYLLDARGDVAAAVRAAQPGGPQRALGWLFLHGVREMGLDDLVDDGIRAWCNAPAEAGGRDARPLTNLMSAVLAFREDLQGRFDLSGEDGRRRLADWMWHSGLIAQGPAAGSSSLSAGRAAERDEEPAAPPLPAHGGCTLVGYAYGELGIGEDVRMMAQALSGSGVPVNIVDFSQGTVARKQDSSAAAHVADGFPYAATVFCLTGFDTARFLMERGFRTTVGRRAIGYWPWELPRWPDPWRTAFGLIDELWVSSRFTQEAFAPLAPVPVLHMPMAVELPRVAAVTRRQFGLPERDFLFLYVFDANSYLDRKNPAAAARAFRRAFPHGNEPVGLVFKVMNPPSDSPVWREFLEHCAGDHRIRILAETLDRPTVLGLIGACDAYVSLHRAEGFGRTIAEAMLLGKPVVATGWSGSNELVRPDTAIAVAASPRPVGPGEYPWGEGTYWAEPDIDHAAWGMRALAVDAALRARLAGAGRTHVRLNHSAAAVGRRYRDRLAALGLL